MIKASILENLEYREDRPSFTILLENDVCKESRILFKKEQVLREHTSRYPIVVEVVEGCIDFTTEGNTHKLLKGNMTFLDANIAHELVAKEDSIVRLSHNKAALNLSI